MNAPKKTTQQNQTQHKANPLIATLATCFLAHYPNALQDTQWLKTIKAPQLQAANAFAAQHFNHLRLRELLQNGRFEVVLESVQHLLERSPLVTSAQAQRFAVAIEASPESAEILAPLLLRFIFGGAYASFMPLEAELRQLKLDDWTIMTALLAHSDPAHYYVVHYARSKAIVTAFAQATLKKRPDFIMLEQLSIHYAAFAAELPWLMGVDALMGYAVLEEAMYLYNKERK